METRSTARNRTSIDHGAEDAPAAETGACFSENASTHADYAEAAVMASADSSSEPDHSTPPMLKTPHLGLRLARRLAGGRPLLYSLVRHSRPARRRSVASPQDFFGLHTGCPGRAPALLGSADMCRRSPHRSRAVVRWAIIWKVPWGPKKLFQTMRVQGSNPHSACR